MADRTGQRVDDYQLLRLLGQGTFGEVYLAQHLYKQLTVALKILTMQVSDEVLENFLREARTLFLLKHPHIVPLLDFGSEKKVPFLVLEYAPNGTLRQRHQPGERVPLEVVNSYVQQIASALQYAHDQRLIHCDVKPQNMLLGQDGQVLLSDFGVAAIAHSEHSMTAQQMAGTMAYVAPEQIQGKPRPASDQYALAICAYEWLCGVRPFTGSSWELMSQHASTPPAKLRTYLPELPEAVEEVILHALAKDQQQRFASVAAFATALWQASQPMSPNFAGVDISWPRRGTTEHTPSSPGSGSTPSNPGQRTPSLPGPGSTPSNPGQRTPSWSGPGPATPNPGQGSIPPVPQSGPSSPTSEPAMSFYNAPTLMTPGPGEMYSAPQQAGAFNPSLPPPGQPAFNAPLPPPGQPAFNPSLPPPGQPAFNPSLPPPGQPVAPHTISRRKVLMAGVAGAIGLAVIGGGVTWVVTSKNGPSQAAQPRLTPTRPATPREKPLYSYKGHAGAIFNVAWSIDGKRIATAGADHTVQVWDALNGANATVFRGHAKIVRSLSFSPDKQFLASASDDKTVLIWNLASSTIFFGYTGHTAAVLAVAWAPAGQKIVSGGFDQTVQIWSPSSNNKPLSSFTLTGGTNYATSIAWSLAGTRLAVASAEGTARIWDIATKKFTVTYEGHTARVNSVSWSPDGARVVSGGSDKKTIIWRSDNGKTADIDRSHTGPVDSVAWSPDGKYIATASNDATVQILDALTYKKIRTYNGHTGPVQSVAWSPDSTYIASAGLDGTAQVWKALKEA